MCFTITIDVFDDIRVLDYNYQKMWYACLPVDPSLIQEGQRAGEDSNW